MKKEIKKIIEFAINCKYSEDSESSNYLSDGEMIDEIIEKLKQLIKYKL